MHLPSAAVLLAAGVEWGNFTFKTVTHISAPVETTVAPKEHYQMVSDIKAKAMKNTVNPIKHRTGVEERR